MYISQEIVERIKKIAQKKNVKLSEMLAECNLGKNTISKMASGTDILTKNFAKIADYLDCSMDYLLGRTDVEEINKKAALPLQFSKINEIEQLQMLDVMSPNIAAETGKKLSAQAPDLDTIIELNEE